MKTTVALVKTSDRAEGIPRLMDLLGVRPPDGTPVLVKPNWNTADPYPASTHNDTLEHMVSWLKNAGAGSITLGERSGPAETAAVIREKRIDTLARRLGVGIINFEELPDEDWVRVRPPDSHWRDGFLAARPVLDAPFVAATCCLKTHGFGGVFTMSLKLSVGIVHKREMAELHGSPRHMRRMIAEVNTAYRPDLILMDGIEVFTDGGPMSGVRKRADVLVAGSDRIAVDALGLAVLKHVGSNRTVMDTPIFRQEQIARAVELGLGATGPADIELVAPEEESEALAARLRQILDTEG
jgi:uncharacterized protein (DUF362 family)